MWGKGLVHLALKVGFCDTSKTEINFKPIEELHELLKAPEAALAKAHSCLHQDIVLDQNHGEAGHELCFKVIDDDFGPGDI